ncbi:DNA-binding transcriptional LysR family regulator [Rhodoferax ferrireducens]|uniref:DNA-binding transcriptional LysR family regulator n=1 Tax=Rhodoferax ferrireducens TaxID=192843 RepID=A0ABU2CDV8_9BURK|nr:LysR family transcriptional regulator [Rhodoferax ferrireducens]MDR7379504.1 DNA-binding transcriptional LysR family regulator [Rhodoferax ferrireducens]
MATDIGWELYRSFLGVLQEGSLSGAARALGVAQPTVGRHIAALEQALKLPLFTRSQAGLLPTEAALALRSDAEAMASTAAALQRTASSQGEGVRGTVRVTASEIIGVEVLPPILTRLRARYPDLKIELLLSNRVQDLLHREADIAVRMLRPQQELLVARRIGTVELGLHAHQRYLEQHGTPRSLADLAQHALIGFDTETPFIRSIGKSLQGVFKRDNFALRSDSDLAHWALIQAGAGIGICQVALARRKPELVRLLPEQASLPLETWITMHENLRHSPRCRATFDALVEGLQQHIA